MAPFRKKPWTEKKGLLVNRSIVALIGIFLLIYGLWYPLKGSLWTYITVTGAIYLSSMSVLLVACCYWKKANSWGAAGAIILGFIVPVAYLIMEQLPEASPCNQIAKIIGPYYSGIASFVLAAMAMILGSWLKLAIHPNTETKTEVA